METRGGSIFECLRCPAGTVLCSNEGIVIITQEDIDQVTSHFIEQVTANFREKSIFFPMFPKKATKERVFHFERLKGIKEDSPNSLSLLEIRYTHGLDTRI
jgi:hypothetical protein